MSISGLKNWIANGFWVCIFFVDHTISYSQKIIYNYPIVGRILQFITSLCILWYTWNEILVLKWINLPKITLFEWLLIILSIRMILFAIFPVKMKKDD